MRTGLSALIFRGMRNYLMSIVALAGTLCVSPAISQDTNLWGEVDGWSIGYDQTLANGCFALTYFPDGTGFRVGFDPTNDAAPLYIMLGNDNWASLEEGKRYDLIIQMDNETPWEAPAVGVTLSDPEFVMLYVATDDPAFLDHFARQHRMRVSYNNRVIADLNLRGSYKATVALSQCQLEGGAPPSDPFVTDSPKPKSDPFSI